jgi:GrpB-like predicted nucleotidyltransferase (UPF0157 family)
MKGEQLNMETLEERIARLVQEDITIVSYNPNWPQMFEQEKKHLLNCLPNELIRRIEHFGSTAIPNLSAKPIIDILVEVTPLEETKIKIAHILESQGYDYFWRPTWGDDIPPFYAWFIKRDSKGHRTHHIHMVENNFEHWDRLFFRDYLIEHPDIAEEYQKLKLRLAKDYLNDRIAYTKEKTEFIVKVTQIAKKYYETKRIKTTSDSHY